MAKMPPIGSPVAQDPDHAPALSGCGDGQPDPAPHGTGRHGVFTAFGLAAEARPLAPGLYVVATPIGNLEDISLRALRILAAANAVLAEDTRITRRLMAHYGISTPLLAYHEHSAEAVRTRMIARLQAGEALALVSDAGTPLVSDPGYKLVQAAIAEGLPVTPIPGPSSVLTALVVSGLPSDRFFFEGFLPAKSGARRNRLAALASIPGTLMLFESAQRLPAMLADAVDLLGPRPAVVARELTKMFETVRRGSLAELAAQFAEEGPPKGEIVVLIGEAAEEDRRADAMVDLDTALGEALASHSIKDAAAIVAARLGLPRRAVYARAIALSRGTSGEVE